MYFFGQDCCLSKQAFVLVPSPIKMRQILKVEIGTSISEQMFIVLSFQSKNVCVCVKERGKESEKERDTSQYNIVTQKMQIDQTR